MLLSDRRVARNSQWGGLFWKLETTANVISKKKKIFAEIESVFLLSKIMWLQHQIQVEITSGPWRILVPIPIGGLFSVFEHKSASKEQKTGYFAYSSGQWGGYCPPPVPPWLRYCFRTRCCQQLATAAIIVWKKLYSGCEMTRRWAPQNSFHASALHQVQWKIWWIIFNFGKTKQLFDEIKQ